MSTIKPTTPISVKISSKNPNFKLDLTTVDEAIQLATMVSFNDWMDATNATGYWNQNQPDHRPELDYRILNNKDTDYSLKFSTAAAVLHHRSILIYIKED